MIDYNNEIKANIKDRWDRGDLKDVLRFYWDGYLIFTFPQNIKEQEKNMKSLYCELLEQFGYNGATEHYREEVMDCFWDNYGEDMRDLLCRYWMEEGEKFDCNIEATAMLSF